MANKELKILVSIDETQVRRSMSFVERLTSMAKKSIEEVNRAQQQSIGGIGRGGGGGGLTARSGATSQNQQGSAHGVGQRLTQALSDQSNIFRAIETGSKDALRAMSGELRRNLTMQKLELKSMGDTVDSLTKKYVTLQGRASAFSKAGAHDLAASVGIEAKSTLQDSFGAMAAKEKQTSLVSSLENSMSKLTDARRGGPYAPVAQGMPGSLDDGTGKNKSGMAAGDIALIASTIARAVGGAIGGVGGAIQSEKTYGERSSATMQQATTGRFLRGMLRGDVRDQYAMRHGKTWDGKNVGEAMGTEGDWGGEGGAWTSLAGKVVGDAAGIVQGVSTVSGAKGGGAGNGKGITRTDSGVAAASGLIGNVGGLWDSWQSATKGGIENADIATRMEGLDDNHAANPLRTAAFDVLAEERGIRASSSRKLMNQHMAARGVGAGYGYQFGESTGIAESLQARNGMQGMYGGHETTGAGQNMSRLQQALNNPDAMAQMAMVTGRDMRGELEAAIRKGTNGTTTSSRGLLSSSMELAGHGINMGVGQDALSNIFQSQGAVNRNLVGADGKPQSNSENAMKSIERAVERGTAKGFTDPKTQEILIGAMGNAAQGKILGDTSGLEQLSNFLTRGGSGNMSVAATQGRVSALAGLDNLSANNPFFQGVNIASAKGILGNKANPLSMMALGGATESELLAGGQNFDVHGISKEQRMHQFENSVASKAQAYMSLLSVEEQGRYKSGGFQALGKDSTFKLLRSMKSFGNDETANGLSEMMTAPGGMANASGGKLRQFADGLAVASISLEETTKAKLMGKEMAKEIADIFKDLSPEKMMEHLRKSEAAMQEEAFRSGKMLIVSVVGPYTGPRDLAANGREGQSTEPK